MLGFEHTALDDKETTLAGVDQPSSRSDSPHKPVRDNILVSEFTGENAPGDSARPSTDKNDLSKRIGSRQVCLAARQLATLLHAGMPLVPALSVLVEQLEKEPLSQIMAEIGRTVNAGAPLADALGQYPRVFSTLFVNMVKAGEASGTLEETLLRMAQMLEKRSRLSSKIKSALAYPLLLTVVAVATVAFLMSFVVPSIARILLDMNRQLPWPTIMLIKMSIFIKTYLPVIFVGTAAVLLALGAYLKTEAGKLAWDRLKLKLPLFGKLFLKVEVARLTRTLGILIGSGMSIMDALAVVIGVSQNRFMAHALKEAKEAIGRGKAVAEAIKGTGLFPPIVLHIIATSEMSGNLEAGLTNIADNTDDEIEITTRTLTSLLEPAIMLAMGAVVAFIVLAILLPIFEINQII